MNFVKFLRRPFYRTHLNDCIWMLDTKVKAFHECISCFMKWPWNCISWNASKEKFHSVSFPYNKFILKSSHQDIFFDIAPVMKLFEKHLWWSAVFSKFACNALQHWTTAAEKPYIITSLINAEQQLMQNTSKKLLLYLETVVCRCSSKYLFLKISQFLQESNCVGVCF